MSYLERKTGKVSAIKTLPNYTAAGSYCFFSQCIELNDLYLKDFLSFLDLTKTIDENYQAILKFAPLLHHEVKHWYDAHSTLWGLRLLRNIYYCRNDLYEAENGGISTSLHHFGQQLSLYDSIQYIKFPEYYSTSSSDANTSKPWKYEFSTGLVFSKHGRPTDRNIFFTRFLNAKGDLIARAPFSLCSLLEASAVAQELNIKVRVISQLEDPISKQIESKNLVKRIIDDLYNENLVEYSVVAHKISNSFKIVDAIESYNIAAKLCRIILNLTDDVFRSFRPADLLLPEFSLFVKPYENALNYIDHGAMFSLLVDALYSQYQSKGVQVNNDDLERLIGEMFINHLNLSMDDVFERSKLEVSKVCAPVDFDLNKEYLSDALSLGKDLHSLFGLTGSHFINLDENMVPDFILGDGAFISQKNYDQQKFEDRYFELTEYFDYLQKFSKACIV